MSINIHAIKYLLSSSRHSAPSKHKTWHLYKIFLTRFQRVHSGDWRECSWELGKEYKISIKKPLSKTNCQQLKPPYVDKCDDELILQEYIERTRMKAKDAVHAGKTPKPLKAFSIQYRSSPCTKHEPWVWSRMVCLASVFASKWESTHIHGLFTGSCICIEGTSLEKIPIIAIQKKVAWYKSSSFLINLKNVVLEYIKTSLVAFREQTNLQKISMYSSQVFTGRLDFLNCSLQWNNCTHWFLQLQSLLLQPPTYVVNYQPIIINTK